MITTKQIIQELKTKYGGVVSDELWRGMHYLVESTLHEKHIDAYMHSYYDCIAETGVSLIVLTPRLITMIGADEAAQDIIEKVYPLSSLRHIDREFIITDPEHKKLIFRFHYIEEACVFPCNPTDTLVKDFYEAVICTGGRFESAS